MNFLLGLGLFSGATLISGRVLDLGTRYFREGSFNILDILGGWVHVDGRKALIRLGGFADVRETYPASASIA